jgi:queuosine precursor transporter
MIRNQPKALWFLILSYSMILVFANWFEARLILVGHFVTGGGTLIFPLTFLLADVLTEVYGYKQTRRAIWVGFLFNILFVAYGYLVTLMPGPDFYQNNTYFNEIVHIDARIMLASLISYLCAEPLNAILIAKLKVKTKGKYMAFRFVFSTIVASAVDSILFSALAFYNTMPLRKLINFIIILWLLKVVIEIICLPFSVYFAKKLKKYEGLDIYDDSTNFNLFSFDGLYDDSDNYKK